jgi:hypothetical protein
MNSRQKRKAAAQNHNKLRQAEKALELDIENNPDKYGTDIDKKALIAMAMGSVRGV